jgi:ABC-2 type transport system ATP-binding protein
MGQGDTAQHLPGSRSPSAKAIPAIDVHDLSKQFGTLAAVDHLSLRVEQGEIFGLLGPNGSGKTTTINLISGLSAPSSGTVTVMGYDVHQAAQEVRKLLGSAPQETALYEEISAQANLSFHADVFGIPRRQKQARIDAVLDLVQLQARRKDRVRTYSGGMKGEGWRSDEPFCTIRRSSIWMSRRWVWMCSRAGLPARGTGP